MQYLKIKVDATTLPPATDYIAFPVTEPTLLVLDDGSAAIKLTNSQYMWFPKETADYMLRLAGNTQPDPQPQPHGNIDSLTLLRAIAIAQQPELAMNLLKD